MTSTIQAFARLEGPPRAARVPPTRLEGPWALSQRRGAGPAAHRGGPAADEPDEGAP